MPVSVAPPGVLPSPKYINFWHFRGRDDVLGGLRPDSHDWNFVIYLLNPDVQEGGLLRLCATSRPVQGSCVLSDTFWMFFGSTWFSLHEWASCSLSHCISKLQCTAEYLWSLLKVRFWYKSGWGPRTYILKSSDTDATLWEASLYLLLNDPCPMVPLIYFTDH